MSIFLMGEIGEKEYYTKSEEYLSSPSKSNAIGFEKYLNAVGNNAQAELITDMNSLKNMSYSSSNYSDLYDGKNPKTGRKFTKKQGQHKPGTDLVMALDKKTSSLYALCNREQKRKFDKIVSNLTQKIIKEEIAKRIKPSCKKGEYSDFDPKQTKLCAVKFTHFENRGVEPHYHNHINLFNFAEFTMNDGTVKTMAIDTQEIFKAQKEISSRFDLELAIALKEEMGIRATSTDNGISIAGLSDDIIEKLSTRKQEIDSYMLEQEKIGKKFSSFEDAEKQFSIAEIEAERKGTVKYKETLRRNSQKEKEEHNYNDLMEILKSKVEATGAKIEDVKKASLNFKAQKNEKEIINDVVVELTKNNGFFSESQYKTLLARKLVDTEISSKTLTTLEKSLEEQIGNKKVVALKHGDTTIYSTKDVIQKTFKTIEYAKQYNKTPLFINKVDDKQLADVRKRVIEKLNQREFKLNDGQIKSLETTISKNKICIIEGDAGTGKTTSTIEGTALAFKEMNFEVIGLSTSGITAKALSEAKIDNTFNLAEFFSKERKFEKQPCLIVDEAGMVSTEHYNQLVDFARKHQAKIVLVGDQKQLASVGYGCMFENLQNNLEKNTQARLDENCRQKTLEQRTIAESFRDADPRKAIELMEQQNLVNKTDSKDDAISKLVKDYIGDDAKTKLAICFNNDNMCTINDKIRNVLVENGTIKKDAIDLKVDVLVSQSAKALRNRTFAEGDKIVFTGKMKANKSLKQKEVENGTFATIKRIDEKKKLIYCVDKENREFVIDTKTHNKFNHAYCVSTYKSQGQTVENAYVFSDGKTNANQSYVDFSRHKNKVALYIEEKNFEKFILNSERKAEKFDIYNNLTAKEVYEQFTKETNHEPKPSSELSTSVGNVEKGNIGNRRTTEQSIIEQIGEVREELRRSISDNIYYDAKSVECLQKLSTINVDATRGLSTSELLQSSPKNNIQQGGVPKSNTNNNLPVEEPRTATVELKTREYDTFNKLCLDYHKKFTYQSKEDIVNSFSEQRTTTDIFLKNVLACEVNPKGVLNEFDKVDTQFHKYSLPMYLRLEELGKTKGLTEDQAKLKYECLQNRDVVYFETVRNSKVNDLFNDDVYKSINNIAEDKNANAIAIEYARTRLNQFNDLKQKQNQNQVEEIKKPVEPVEVPSMKPTGPKPPPQNQNNNAVVNVKQDKYSKHNEDVNFIVDSFEKYMKDVYKIDFFEDANKTKQYLQITDKNKSNSYEKGLLVDCMKTMLSGDNKQMNFEKLSTFVNFADEIGYKKTPYNNFYTSDLIAKQINTTMNKDANKIKLLNSDRVLNGLLSTKEVDPIEKARIEKAQRQAQIDAENRAKAYVLEQNQNKKFIGNKPKPTIGISR